MKESALGFTTNEHAAKSGFQGPARAIELTSTSAGAIPKVARHRPAIATAL